MATPSLAPASSSFTPPAVSREAHVEALLRERKLDRTLTSNQPGWLGADAVAAFAMPPLDDSLRGGLPRGHVSELIGPASSGRTSLACTWLAAATARGELVALIDTFDRFDPLSGQGCGVNLSRLLWVRGQAITRTASAIDPAWRPGVRAVEGPGTLLERTIDRAIKALHLILQSGVCTAVVFDLADVPPAGIRRIPHTTWFRLQRAIEGSETACLLIGTVPLARSSGGVTITTDRTNVPLERSVFRPAVSDTDLSRRSSPDDRSRAEADTASRGAAWRGSHDRARRLGGLKVMARVSSPRRNVEGTAALDTVTRHHAWAID